MTQIHLHPQSPPPPPLLLLSTPPPPMSPSYILSPSPSSSPPPTLPKRWIFPQKEKRNVTSAINSIYFGKPEINDKNLYRKKIQTISLETYYDIIENILHFQKNQKNNINNKQFKFLKITKLGILTKTCFKNIQKFMLGICPRCNFSNCIFCCKKNISTHSIITCFHCKNIFKASIKKKTQIEGFENKKCQTTYENLFLEYLKY